MHEIERILEELAKERLKYLGHCYMEKDLALIKAGLIKAAYSAIIDGGVALSICSYIEKKSKEESNV